METSDRKSFIDSMTILAEQFDKPLSAALIERYFEELSAHPWPMVDAALRQAGRICRFWPRIAELLEILEGTPDDQAEAAWMGMIAATRRIGAYTSIRCEDPALAETIRQVFGTWPDACLLPTEGPEYGVKRRDFLDTYRQVSRLPAPELTSELMGIFEADNRQRVGAIDHGRLPAHRVVGIIGRHGRIAVVQEPQPAELKALTLDDGPFALPEHTTTGDDHASRLRRDWEPMTDPQQIAARKRALLASFPPAEPTEKTRRGVVPEADDTVIRDADVPF